MSSALPLPVSQTPRRAASPCAVSAFVRQTSRRSLQRPSENKGSGAQARQLSGNPSLDELLLLSSGQGTVAAETQYVPNIPCAVTSALGDTVETQDIGSQKGWKP